MYCNFFAIPLGTSSWWGLVHFMVLRGISKVGEEEET